MNLFLCNLFFCLFFFDITSTLADPTPEAAQSDANATNHQNQTEPAPVKKSSTRRQNTIYYSTISKYHWDVALFFLFFGVFFVAGWYVYSHRRKFFKKSSDKDKKKVD